MDDTNLKIYCAALQGITSNPEFFGPLMQQSPELASEFARRCVRAAYRHDGKRAFPDITGSDGSINSNNFGEDPNPSVGQDVGQESPDGPNN